MNTPLLNGLLTKAAGKGYAIGYRAGLRAAYQREFARMDEALWWVVLYPWEPTVDISAKFIGYLNADWHRLRAPAETAE